MQQKLICKFSKLWSISVKKIGKFQIHDISLFSHIFWFYEKCSVLPIFRNLKTPYPSARKQSHGHSVSAGEVFLNSSSTGIIFYTNKICTFSRWSDEVFNLTLALKYCLFGLRPSIFKGVTPNTNLFYSNVTDRNV